MARLPVSPERSAGQDTHIAASANATGLSEISLGFMASTLSLVAESSSWKGLSRGDTVRGFAVGERRPAYSTYRMVRSVVLVRKFIAG